MTSQSQKTVDLVRELLSMELNYINVRHPDFNGVHMERVRVEATAKVRKVCTYRKGNVNYE